MNQLDILGKMEGPNAMVPPPAPKPGLGGGEDKTSPDYWSTFIDDLQPDEANALVQAMKKSGLIEGGSPVQLGGGGGARPLPPPPPPPMGRR